MSAQLARFAVVGILLNGALYCVYLLLTHTVFGSQAAMTVVYVSGVLIGFLLNRKVTFRYDGPGSWAVARYVAAYVIGYVINWVALWLLAGRAGVAHEVVQLAMCPTLAVLLFALQRYWVFPARSGTPINPSLRRFP